MFVSLGEPCLPGHAKLEVYSTPSNTNQRLWSKIARNIPEETLIVFYTSCKVPPRSRKVIPTCSNMSMTVMMSALTL